MKRTSRPVVLGIRICVSKHEVCDNWLRHFALGVQTCWKERCESEKEWTCQHRGARIALLVNEREATLGFGMLFTHSLCGGRLPSRCSIGDPVSLHGLNRLAHAHALAHDRCNIDRSYALISLQLGA